MPRGGFGAVDVAVCTIEKANNILNRLLEDDALDMLGMVVIDELHFVSDEKRGSNLEILITKLLYVTRDCEADQRVQMIG